MPTTDSKVTPKKTRKHGPHKKTARRRQQILEAATQVFGAKGFYAGSLKDIAALVGMTHSGILHHFGSKQQLLQAVISYRDQSEADQANAARGLDLFQHLIDTARANTARPGIVQTYVVLSAESVTDDHPGESYFTERFAGLRQMILDQLRLLTPADHPMPEPLLAASACNIIALMDGLQIQWLLDPAAVDLTAATASGIEAILAAVMAGA
ncbi:MAG: TetR/AcrR family transcriptional regulator [Propionibacteriaceae bacterium]|jgi:AcrR family transcriptional regulator|nr:TetR/AcrR family transcriptional regulator [Propionibacteriaceae bacterium]